LGRKSKAHERRDQIIWALYECLSEKGHEKVTIKGIAEQAGLPHGVIHYYFKSKDEIVSALVEALQIKYETVLSERISSVSSSRKALLETAVDYLAEQHVFDARLNRVFYNLVQMAFERSSIGKSLRKALRKYRNDIIQTLCLSDNKEETTIQAAVIVAIVEGLALQWMIEPGFLNREQLKAMLTRTIENFLKE
jgi:AcrR family transcriptional regulator